MNDRQVTIYVFRDPAIGGAKDTLVAVAPRADVDDCFGVDGLTSTFGGYAVYKNDATDDRYVGVWGARNAAKFRAALRRHYSSVSVIRDKPSARLSVRVSSSSGRKIGSP